MPHEPHTPEHDGRHERSKLSIASLRRAGNAIEPGLPSHAKEPTRTALPIDHEASQRPPRPWNPTKPAHHHHGPWPESRAD